MITVGGSAMTPLETILRSERTIILAALATVVSGCWAYLLGGAGLGMATSEMASWRVALGLGAGEADTAMGATMAAMATPVRWSPAYAGLMVVMWWVMMIAMMLPSAAPMILLYAGINRRRRAASDGHLPAGVFALGYAVIWGAFSVLATALQWALESAELLSPMLMNSTSQLLAGALLLSAGLYQVTLVKDACLRHCRNPVQFVIRHWRPGRLGAFRAGLAHGAYCVGCCWGLMALLFFGGVMNLYWIAGLAALVLVEKLLPAGRTVGVVLGAVFVFWGAAFLYRALA
jgi:predicted metal-binding membrane protein